MLKNAHEEYKRHLTTDKCEKHNTHLIHIDGENVCPDCRLEEKEEELRSKVTEQKERADYIRRINNLKDNSILTDELAITKTIKNYQPVNDREKRVGNEVFAVHKHLKLYYDQLNNHINNAEEYPAIQNVWLYGPTGSGKTHLGMALLHLLNDGNKTCMFVSVSKMLREIRSSYNKSSSVSEEDIINRCVNADYLLLDDLGSESIGSGWGDGAREYTQRVLIDILDGRQSKPTIVTTNLDYVGMHDLYDARIVSRLASRYVLIDFTGIKDKRLYGGVSND